MTRDVMLGIDPGSSKTGAALLDTDGHIIKTEVLLMVDFAEELKQFLADYNVVVCVLGNGTTSEMMAATIKTVLPGIKLRLIDEAHSTEEARLLYWELNPPRGLRKLFPTTMQVPPQNLDGYAAAVLVRRYLKWS